jgi:hypothetical protein
MTQEKIAKKLGSENDILHMAEGFPLPVCKFKRTYFSPIFKGIATYGYCASKAETYYGLKLNLVINSWGLISGITFALANCDERESLWELAI